MPHMQPLGQAYDMAVLMPKGTCVCLGSTQCKSSYLFVQIRESGERLGAVLDDIVAAYYTVRALSQHAT